MAQVLRRGDIVIVDLDPALGHEQKGRRPALVVSHDDFNKQIGLVFVCPITSKVRGNEFEVLIDTGKTKGAILPHQTRAIDFRGRKVIVKDCVADFVVTEVARKIKLIIE